MQKLPIRDHQCDSFVDFADAVKGLGRISIRAISGDEVRPSSSSIYDEWGEMAPEAKDMVLLRWKVEADSEEGNIQPVGDMFAHPVWYGPTISSKAMNIGISLFSHQGLRYLNSRTDLMNRGASAPKRVTPPQK